LRQQPHAPHPALACHHSLQPPPLQHPIHPGACPQRARLARCMPAPAQAVPRLSMWVYVSPRAHPTACCAANAPIHGSACVARTHTLPERLCVCFCRCRCGGATRGLADRKPAGRCARRPCRAARLWPLRRYALPCGRTRRASSRRKTSYAGMQARGSVCNVVPSGCPQAVHRSVSVRRLAPGKRAARRRLAARTSSKSRSAAQLVPSVEPALCRSRLEGSHLMTSLLTHCEPLPPTSAAVPPSVA
jgi:hypothetical protein